MPIVLGIIALFAQSTFDILSGGGEGYLDSFTGLIFFLTLPGPRDMMAAFEQMLDTARGVAENLGGDVLDESRSATTRQTLEHMRQRIRDLERKLLAQAGR